MSDEELVKRLRDDVNGEHDMTPHGADCLQAADRIEALTAERDNYAFKLADANNTYSEMHVELEALTEQLAAAQGDAKEAEAYAEELEAKVKSLTKHHANMADPRYWEGRYRDEKNLLAKAVEALENVIGEYDLFRKDEYERGLAPLDDEIHEARATLAEIKGESHEALP